MLSFSPAVDYPVGVNPIHVVSADFNSDGRLDLATDNASVSVMLGNADGTFQAAQNTPGGTSLAVGDFNDDGKLDLATADSVRLGNGNGTFQAPTSIGIDIDSIPDSVAVGDFNADGKLDLGVTSNVYYPGHQGYYGWYWGHYVGRANVLLGRGDGSFSAPHTTSLGFMSLAPPVLADFNADGNLDFATTGFEYGYDGKVIVLLGTGTGALGTPNYFSSAYPATSVAAGDVNGDGDVDLVTANEGYCNMGVLLGTGAGSFAAAQFYPAGGSPYAVALSDFNGDGKVDLLTTNWVEDAVGVLLGAGDGTFRPPVSIAAGDGPLGVAVGDFNGDGRLDLATANHYSNNVSVLLSDGIWPALDPSITIGDATVTEGNTGTSVAIFTVNLSEAYGQTVSVHYATADGSATAADEDYQAAAGDVTFAPGVTSQTVTVLINGDRLAESSESFFVSLTNPTNGFIIDASGTGAIVDDEPVISMGDNVQVTEGNTGTTSAVYTVSLSRAYDQPVSVNFSTAEGDTHFEGGGPYGYYYSHTPAATSGSDFQGQTGVLTFAPGQTSKNITVAVNGDRLPESTEYFSVDLSSPSANAALGDDHALGTIVDDEPRITVNSTQVVEGNSGTTNASFIVTLSTASDQVVTVAYNTVDGSAGGSDYIAASGLLTFNPGQTQKAVSVAVMGDVRDEYDESFYLQLTAASGAEIVSSSATGTIVDNDPPPSLSISDASVVEGNSGTKLMVFTVTLSAASGKDVWVDYSTSNGTAKTSDNDYVATSGSLYFAPGVTTRTISVVIKGDKRKEQSESFNLNLFNAYDAVFADAIGVGNILNDD